MFQQILATLGQMDGQYQKKTKILATVKQCKPVEFSKTSGKPGQSFVLTAENGEESWVKLVGKFDPMENCVGNKYEWHIWPFKADQAPKPSLYCWVNGLVHRAEGNQSQQAAPQNQRPAPQAQQPANAPHTTRSATDISIERQVCVKAVAEIVARMGGQMKIDEAIGWCCEFHRWITDGRPTMRTQPSGLNPDYVGDDPPPPEDDLPF